MLCLLHALVSDVKERTGTYSSNPQRTELADSEPHQTAQICRSACCLSHAPALRYKQNWSRLQAG